MVAREAFLDGPALDVTLADMEEYAVAASGALLKGAVESMTATQGGQLGEEAPCPVCGKVCPLTRKSRPVAVRSGDGHRRSQRGAIASGHARGGREGSRHRSTQDHPPRHDLFDQQRGAHGLPTISPGGTPAHPFPGGVPRKTDQQAGQRGGKVLERRTFGGSDSSTASRGDLRRRPPSSLDHQPPSFPVFPKMSTARAR